VIVSFNAKRHFFLIFHFSIKNRKGCGTLIKEMGRNAKHDSLTWSKKCHFRGAMLLSKPKLWRVFWPLRCFKMWVHLQPSMSHPCTQKGVTLQIFRSPTKKWKVDY